MQNPRILVVDDEDIHVDIIRKILVEDHYSVIDAESGEKALSILNNDHAIDLIVLDYVMPGIDGLSVLRKIKATARMRQIPVIMYSVSGDSNCMIEGFASGAYHYLVKPCPPKLVRAVVRNALRNAWSMQKAMHNVEQLRGCASGMDMGLQRANNLSFAFSTTKEAEDVSCILSRCYPCEPDRMAVGIRELLCNAIEHGNYGVTYRKKNELIMNDLWEEELLWLERQNRHKKADVTLLRDEEGIALTIKDEGIGFDWEPYLTLDASRACSPNGHGIMLASRTFHNMTYNDKGNQVKCITRYAQQKGEQYGLA